jgi:hypothetical protein
MHIASRYTPRMRTFPLVALALVACVPSARRNPPPARPFLYAREFGELFEAIDDLNNSTSDAVDGSHAATTLSDLFTTVCRPLGASCDPASWRHAWSNHGDSGKNLAHALSAIDRIYAVWKRRADVTHLVSQPIYKLDDARREVRDLLFTREHIGLEHLPEHKGMIVAAEELRYARRLIGDAPPPAQVPWDADATRAMLEQQAAVLEQRYPDDATTPYAPDPADFGNMTYVGRMMIARDLIVRAMDDVTHDPAVGELRGGGAFSTLQNVLFDAEHALAATVDHVLPGAPRYVVDNNAPDPYDKQLAILAYSRFEMVHHGLADIERLHSIVDQALKDAFLAATAAEHLPPDKRRWAVPPDDETDRDQDDGHERIDLEAADAVLSMAPDGRFAEARRLLAPAFPAIAALEAMEERWDAKERPYFALHQQLALALDLLDVEPPADHPWNARSAIADIKAAIADIDAAKLADKSRYVAPIRKQPPTLDYAIRLVVAHDGIERALQMVESSPGKGPQAAAAKARAIVDELAAAIKPRPVTAQAGARRR